MLNHASVDGRYAIEKEREKPSRPNYAPINTFHSYLQIHQNQFKAFNDVQSKQDQGEFVLDEFVGRDTQFAVMADKTAEYSGFLRSITIYDDKERNNRYKGTHWEVDNVFTVNDVPFDKKESINAKWKYELDRMSPRNPFERTNEHFVRVTSRAKLPGSGIKIRFFTNIETYSATISDKHPVKLFAEVRLKCVPVVNARVTVKIEVVSADPTKITEPINVTLLDNGSGGKQAFFSLVSSVSGGLCKKRGEI